RDAHGAGDIAARLTTARQRAGSHLHLRGFGQSRGSRRVQGVSVGIAREQGAPERRFEVGQAARHGGVRDLERASGRRQCTVARQRREKADVFLVNRGRTFFVSHREYFASSAEVALALV